jgi:hypothetical protein
MKPWLALFDDKSTGCVIASSHEEAGCIAHEETGAAPIDVVRVPLPFRPLINKTEPWKLPQIPGECTNPTQCAGHMTCPHPVSSCHRIQNAAATPASFLQLEAEAWVN